MIEYHNGFIDLQVDIRHLQAVFFRRLDRFVYLNGIIANIAESTTGKWQPLHFRFIAGHESFDQLKWLSLVHGFGTCVKIYFPQGLAVADIAG